MASALEDNGGVYFVPAFVGLGAPHWEPEARGAMYGLTRGTTRDHLTRAALEAMAYGTAEVLHAMEADSGVATAELRVDGGAALNDWLMQFQADVIATPVRRPAIVETTALGAAGLAGIATGVWSSADDFLSSQGDPARFEPAWDQPRRDAAMAEWSRAVRATVGWARDGSHSQ